MKAGSKTDSRGGGIESSTLGESINNGIRESTPLDESGARQYKVVDKHLARMKSLMERFSGSGQSRVRLFSDPTKPQHPHPQVGFNVMEFDEDGIRKLVVWFAGETRSERDPTTAEGHKKLWKDATKWFNSWGFRWDASKKSHATIKSAWVASIEVWNWAGLRLCKGGKNAINVAKNGKRTERAKKDAPRIAGQKRSRSWVLEKAVSERGSSREPCDATHARVVSRQVDRKRYKARISGNSNGEYDMNSAQARVITADIQARALPTSTPEMLPPLTRPARPTHTPDDSPETFLVESPRGFHSSDSDRDMLSGGVLKDEADRIESFIKSVYSGTEDPTGGPEAFHDSRCRH